MNVFSFLRNENARLLDLSHELSRVQAGASQHRAHNLWDINTLQYCKRELQIHFTNQSEDYQLQVRVLQREYLNCLSFYSRLVTYKLFAPNSVSLFFRLLNYRLMISPQFDIGGDHQKCKSSRLSVLVLFDNLCVKSCVFFDQYLLVNFQKNRKISEKNENFRKFEKLQKKRKFKKN